MAIILAWNPRAHSFPELHAIRDSIAAGAKRWAGFRVTDNKTEPRRGLVD